MNQTEKAQAEKVYVGAQEVLAQLAEFITHIKASTYGYRAVPYFNSSIGQHVRHVLDLYHSLLACEHHQHALIDYDIRRREHPLEAHPEQACQEIYAMQQVLREHTTPHDHHVLIKTEVSCQQSESVELPSSFIRELCFVSIHAIHHLALMSAIARMAHDPVAGQYGIAPATASYLREQTEMP